MTVFRIEVRVPEGSQDPRGNAALKQANDAGFSPSSIDTTAVYLIEGLLDESSVQKIAD